MMVAQGACSDELDKQRLDIPGQLSTIRGSTYVARSMHGGDRALLFQQRNCC